MPRAGAPYFAEKRSSRPRDFCRLSLRDQSSVHLSAFLNFLNTGEQTSPISCNYFTILIHVSILSATKHRNDRMQSKNEEEP